MNRVWARDVAERCVEAINRGDKEGFWDVLNPVLDSKVPFPLLDEIGRVLGQKGKADVQRYFDVFDDIVASDKMGGYVVVGQALTAFFETSLEESIVKARDVVVKGRTWYVCDIVGERVFGQALVDHFDEAVLILERMTAEEDEAVRRSIGVGVHFFAKRRPNDVEELKRLLSLLSLLVEDRRVFVVKGVGWGLKTMGRRQPVLVEEFLWRILESKRVSKLLMRKATTYLDGETKKRLLERWQSGA